MSSSEKEILPELKKRKVDDGAALPARRASSQAPEEKDKADASLGKFKMPPPKARGINLQILQARNFAVAQAQQDKCTGNYRIFDSLFGNYLVPVVPTRADLGD